MSIDNEPINNYDEEQHFLVGKLASASYRLSREGFFFPRKLNNNDPWFYFNCSRHPYGVLFCSKDGGKTFFQDDSKKLNLIYQRKMLVELNVYYNIDLIEKRFIKNTKLNVLSKKWIEVGNTFNRILAFGVEYNPKTSTINSNTIFIFNYF